MAISKQHLQVIIDGDNKSGAAFQSLESDANRSLGKGSKGLGGLGKGAAMALGAAAAGIAGVGAGLYASIKTAGDFQQKMAGVTATLGSKGTTGAIQKLEKVARKMGSETSFSASQAAEGMKALAQAGFEVDEIAEALPATLELAAAGGLELSEAASIASGTIRGMRLETSDLSRIVDGMAVTASSSNTSVKELGEAFGRGGGQAAVAGLEFEETAAILGVLADNTIAGGEGGTALSAALRTMINPGREAEQMATDLGLSFVDTTGKVRPMADIIQELEEKQVSAKDSMIMFGDEGGRAINALVGSGNERLRSLKRSIEDSGGAAERMADVQMGTFEGAMKGVGSATEGLMITIGQRFLPILQNMLENYVAPTVRKFTEWLDAVGDFGSIFSDAFSIVQGYMEGIWKVIDTAFSSPEYGKSFWATLGAVFNGAVELVKNFGINFGNILYEFSQILWLPLEFAFGLIWPHLQAMAFDGINAIAGSFTDGINGIIEGFNEIGDAFGVTIDKLDFTPLAVDAPESVTDGWAKMKEGVLTHVDGLETAGSTMADQLSTDWEKLVPEVEKVWEMVEVQVDDSTKAIASTFTEKLINPIKKDAKKGGEDVGTNVVEGMSNELQTTNNKTEIRRRGSKLGEWFGGGMAASVKTSTAGITATLFDPSQFEGVKGGFDEMVGGDFLGGFETLMNDPTEGVGAVLVTALQTAQSGGSFEMVGGGVGMAIGAIVGGAAGAQIGAMIGQSVGGVARLVTRMFSGRDKGEAREKIIDEVSESIQEGDLTNFAAFKNLSAVIQNVQDAKKTADALMDAFGISFDSAVDLINIYKVLREGTVDDLKGHAAAEEGFPDLLASLENLQIVMGAVLERGQLAQIKTDVIGVSDAERGLMEFIKKYEDQRKAAGQDPFTEKELDNVRRIYANALMGRSLSSTQGVGGFQSVGMFQSGFSGYVTKPTMFVAGEQGLEHVQVTPSDSSGFAGGGSMGGMQFTFNINALDVRGVEAAIGNEIAPLVIDRIRAASRRGEGIMHSDGLISERRV